MIGVLPPQQFNLAEEQAAFFRDIAPVRPVTCRCVSAELRNILKQACKGSAYGLLIAGIKDTSTNLIKAYTLQDDSLSNSLLLGMIAGAAGGALLGIAIAWRRH